MEQIWQRGIDFIITVQKIRTPFVDSFFMFITFFGSIIFYMIFLPFLYWCYDKKFAARVFIIFFISGWMNSVIKDLVNHPRPYNLNQNVKIGNTGGPGFPSGHAQQSLAVFGSLALHLKNMKYFLFSACAVLLIAFSRIYLGVHFPTDVFGGWFFGALVLIIIFPVFDIIEKFMSGVSPAVSALLAVVIPAALSFIVASESSVMSMGALSGFCLGLILEKKYINFTPSENLKEIILRYVSGILVLLVLYSSEKFLSGREISFYLVIVFVHSWIISIWVSAGAPWLFKKCGI